MIALQTILMSFFSGFFMTTPIVLLASLIIVPAHQRIVFVGAVDLVLSIFFGAFLEVFVPWIWRQEWMQDILRNMTNSTEEVFANSSGAIDEL